MVGWKHLHLSPLNNVLDHTNHIVSESLSSGDDNEKDVDKYIYKDTQTQTKTNTTCFQDPMYAIFLKQGVQGYQIWHFHKKCPPKFSTKYSTDFHNNCLPNIFHQNQFSTCLLIAWIFEYRTVYLV